MYGCSKDCLILIPFRLPQISCYTLRLKYFSSDSDNCPSVGIGPLLQFPHPLRAGPVLLTLLLSPRSSFILLSFVWPYIFFSAGRVFLSAFSWYSACTSVCEGVFLMYLWTEMYSMSTYSSTILFSSWLKIFISFLDFQQSEYYVIKDFLFYFIIYMLLEIYWYWVVCLCFSSNLGMYLHLFIQTFFRSGQSFFPLLKILCLPL